jgi:DNA-binding NarL/FixJ family response regulator
VHERIHVALVDDQTIARAGLARLLSPGEGFDIVAECVDGNQASEQLPTLRPDVVLIAIRMPGLDGIAATAQLSGTAHAGAIVVLTTFGEDEVLWGAIEAGAAGFVLEDSAAHDLVAAVRAVAAGGAWFDPGVAPRVLDRYRRVVAPATRDAARLHQLTDREHDVLRRMARGATNAEIAASLYIAEATVKTHIGSIFTKLDVRDRAAAIVFAYDHAVVSPGSTPAPDPAATHDWRAARLLSRPLRPRSRSRRRRSARPWRQRTSVTCGSGCQSAGWRALGKRVPLGT